ncbi:heavy metal translocating P-type ATPase domain protein [Mycobacterium kansasii 732]|nr:heavy metal translocating P-type ATPase domain protein [Mycobacterium kansasii 732]
MPTPMRPCASRLMAEGANVEAPIASARTFIPSATGPSGVTHAVITEPVSSAPDSAARRSLTTCHSCSGPSLSSWSQQPSLTVRPGRPGAPAHEPDRIRVLQSMTLCAKPGLRPSAERGARSGTAVAGVCTASAIADRTAAVSQRAGACQMTTEAVRGYACTASTPATSPTASSIAMARISPSRNPLMHTRIRPEVADTTVSLTPVAG